jgi:hypothetical protein
MERQELDRITAQLWRDLGYDGCRKLREALRLRLAEHRQVVAEQRLADGSARPRSQRKPTTSRRTAEVASAAVGDVSETAIDRLHAVRKYAPHLYAQVSAGTLKVWPAYQEAIRARDAAAVAILTAD